MNRITFESGVDNVGTGWHPIAKALHTAIEALAPGYTIRQIKEKFGGLRYYYTLPDGTPEDVVQTVRVLTSACELLSVNTCEECGENGKNRVVGSWITTLCNEHYEEAEARRKQITDELNAGVAARLAKRKQES